MPNKAAEVIRETAKKWPASFVARVKFEEFSGGLYAAGTMANFDSRGEGPEGAFKIGRQQCYPVDRAAEWLISKLGRSA